MVSKYNVFHFIKRYFNTGLSKGIRRKKDPQKKDRTQK